MITLAHVTRSLDGVRALRIEGWGLKDNWFVQPVDDGPFVTLWAPRLTRGEEWVADATQAGVLVLRSNLVGTTDFAGGRPSGSPLVLKIPNGRLGQIEVIVE